MRCILAIVVVIVALPTAAAAHSGGSSWPQTRANLRAATVVPRALNPLAHPRARCAGYDPRPRRTFRHFSCILQSRDGSFLTFTLHVLSPSRAVASNVSCVHYGLNTTGRRSCKR